MILTREHETRKSDDKQDTRDYYGYCTFIWKGVCYVRHGIWRLVYTGEKYLSVTVLYIHFFLDFCPMDTRLKSGSSIASIESRSSFLSFFLFFFSCRLRCGLFVPQMWNGPLMISPTAARIFVPPSHTTAADSIFSCRTHTPLEGTGDHKMVRLANPKINTVDCLYWLTWLSSRNNISRGAPRTMVTTFLYRPRSNATMLRCLFQRTQLISSRWLWRISKFCPPRVLLPFRSIPLRTQTFPWLKPLKGLIKLAAIISWLTDAVQGPSVWDLVVRFRSGFAVTELGPMMMRVQVTWLSSLSTTLPMRLTEYNRNCRF